MFMASAQAVRCAQGAPKPAKQGMARRAVLAVPVLPAVASVAQAARAATSSALSEEDAANPLIQELLRRTAEKKDERAKERLDDYYRRNYTDYFNFESGNREGLSPETKQRIKDFLDKQSEKSK